MSWEKTANRLWVIDIGLIRYIDIDSEKVYTIPDDYGRYQIEVIAAGFGGLFYYGNYFEFGFINMTGKNIYLTSLTIAELPNVTTPRYTTLGSVDWEGTQPGPIEMSCNDFRSMIAANDHHLWIVDGTRSLFKLQISDIDGIAPPFTYCPYYTMRDVLWLNNGYAEVNISTSITIEAFTLSFYYWPSSYDNT